MGQILVVTGLTGKKSGGAFAECLRDHAEEIRAQFPGGIRAMVRPTSDLTELRSVLPEAEVRAGDFSDAAFLAAAMQDADTLFHIAGIHLSLPLVKAAAEAGVRRMILVHTTGIYSKFKEAGEEYRQIDRQIEEICRLCGVILTILRPTMIYGRLCDNNLVTFIKMVDRLPVMPVVNGARYALQPVYYGDLAKAYYEVLARETATGGKNYVLSGGREIQLREMLTEIGAQLGKKKVRFASVPFPVAYGGATLVYWLSLRRKDYREKVQRLCEPRVYSHEEASRDFGYDPLPFEDGIRGEIREYLSTKAAK
jgi:uncharacterized protein YbjT (DUF2867 family)